jgi:D-arabinose 1-dehydrogenase-like Zn-dependent alcohol dehydrogenase
MSTTYGQAALFYGTGKPFEIKEYPVPDPQPGAAVVRVTLANICGSDLHQWRGELDVVALGKKVPVILGHEMTGVVHRLGEGVTTDSTGQPLKEGDRVIYRYFFPCGRCRACLQRRYNVCPNRMGHLAKSCEEWPHFTGAYAQYYYLWPNHAVFKVPDSLTDEMVAGVNCALTQVIEGLRRVGFRFGETLVVQGAGGLGVYATAVAKEMGAGKVIVIDGVTERLELAAAFGADEIIDLREVKTPEARVARVKELTGGWGADVVAELVGHVRVVEEGFQMMAPGGRYLGIGNINVGMRTPFDPSWLILGNRTFYGVAHYEAETLKEALDFMERTRNRYPYHRILSHKFPLSAINEAFAEQDKGHVTRASLVP